MPNQKEVLQPLVSIIVITYNSAKYVIETLESAKEQTYQNIELIVTDDCSTDETVSICETWIRRNRTRFVNTELITVNENTGIPSNCNRGIARAKGEWVKLIAGDDCLKKDAIVIYMDYINLNPLTKFLHAKMDIFMESFSVSNKMPYFDYDDFSFNKETISPKEQFQILLRINPLNAPTSFIKSELFVRFGVFNEGYRLWEDRPMWLKLTENGIKLNYIDFVTVRYRRSSDSVQVKKNNSKIFAEFEILKEGYMMDYNSYLGSMERIIKTIEYNRKKILDKVGLNKIAILPRIINVVTGYFFIRYINRLNEKYYFINIENNLIDKK